MAGWSVYHYPGKHRFFSRTLGIKESYGRYLLTHRRTLPVKHQLRLAEVAEVRAEALLHVARELRASARAIDEKAARQRWGRSGGEPLAAREARLRGEKP